MNEPVAIRYDFDGYGYQYMDSGSGSDWQTRVEGEFLYTHPVNTCKHGVDDGACKECYQEVTHPVEEQDESFDRTASHMAGEYVAYKAELTDEEIIACFDKSEPVAWVYPEGLEALKAGKPWTAYGTRQEPNNTALYLSSQPDIAPYAWVTFTPYGDEDDVWYENPEGQLLEGWTYKPLYDTTPPKHTWVGLTNGEMIELSEMKLGSWDLILEVEAKLKEKNT